MSLETSIYKPDDLPPLVRYQILSFLRVWDTEGFVGRGHGRRWIGRPEFNPVHVVLMDDDFLVAHTEVVSMNWQHVGIDYQAYGISSVFVYPDYRNMGHGLRIVQSATEYILQQPDADIGMFWCAPELRGFYLHTGWEHIEGAVTMLGDTREQAQLHDEEILFMRYFSPKGQQHRGDFQTSPVFFGWTTW